MADIGKLVEEYLQYRTLRVRSCEELKGEVGISGAKNSALPLLAASLLAERVELENFPLLLDTLYSLQVLQLLGKEVSLKGKGKIEIKGDITSYEVPYSVASRFRGSILFMGGLLGAVGKAKVAHPGGCAIGSRPIDQHLKFLESLGGQITKSGGYIYVRLPKRPKKRNFSFDIVTVTGTENALLTLTAFEGEFFLNNIALEPEVLDLLEFLKSLGIKYRLEGRSLFLSLPGRKNLKRQTTHKVIPDRIEAGTFLVIGALLGNPLKVKGINLSHLGAVVEKLTQAGIKLKRTSDNEVEVYRVERPKGLFIETAPYPGFPTDMQAQFMAMLSVAEGNSLITEKIFENRFQHALELARMGADITIKGQTAFIKGVRKLEGAPVRATDLRASASLVIAGLIAKGETLIEDIGHLLRGYENMDQKLQRLGCFVQLER